MSEASTGAPEDRFKKPLAPYLARILRGETVQIGVFNVREDFVYKREKDAAGRPLFDRVISMVYFDEEEDNNPATEEFDGTMESLISCLDAHDAFESFEAIDCDDDAPEEEE